MSRMGTKIYLNLDESLLERLERASMSERINPGRAYPRSEIIRKMLRKALDAEGIHAKDEGE